MAGSAGSNFYQWGVKALDYIAGIFPAVKYWTKVASAMIALLAVLTAAIEFIPQVEPYFFAHHHWVREKITPIKVQISATNHSIDLLLRHQLEESRDRVLRDPAFSTSAELQRRKNELDDEISDVNSRIKTYIKQQKGK